MSEPTKVLIVDDSAFMRHTLAKLLTSDPTIEVVDVARDGLDALNKLDQLEVDVVTLDVEMPRMDGLSALKEIMSRRPVPVVMVSSSTQQGADSTIAALSLGAVDFVCKPSGSVSLNMQVVAEDLRAKVKQAAATSRNRLRCKQVESVPSPIVRAVPRRARTERIGVVAIGSSTGGPKALHEVLPRIGKGFPVPIVVVQHMPPGFTRSLAEHLDRASAINVREASKGDVLAAGQALIAPGGYHLTISPGGSVELDQRPTVHGVRPSVDVMFDSLARVYGSACLAVVLTGMGADGAAGALKIKGTGGLVIAEDESTCVVYGMPKSAIENGAAEKILPIQQVAGAIEQIVHSGRGAISA